MFAPDILSGSYVRFKLANVICPDVEQIVEKITRNLELTGRVLFLSDAGKKRDYYAVVEVGGIMSPLIIPVSRLESLGANVKNDITQATRE